jgi:hypothetical protein
VDWGWGGSRQFVVLTVDDAEGASSKMGRVLGCSGGDWLLGSGAC